MNACPCDALPDTTLFNPTASLAHLARQTSDSRTIRRQILRTIRWQNYLGATPLMGWFARQDYDLGLMLLEMWAIIGDVVGFYDEQIANECYLLRRLASLPRPSPAFTACATTSTPPCATSSRHATDGV